MLNFLHLIIHQSEMFLIAKRLGKTNSYLFKTMAKYNQIHQIIMPFTNSYKYNKQKKSEINSTLLLLHITKILQMILNHCSH